MEAKAMNELFQEMDDLVSNFFNAPPFRSVSPAYCDYIAAICATGLKLDPDALFKDIGRIELDLDRHGALLSTKKTIDVTDINGKKYRISVEEA